MVLYEKKNHCEFCDQRKKFDVHVVGKKKKECHMWFSNTFFFYTNTAYMIYMKGIKRSSTFV